MWSTHVLTLSIHHHLPRGRMIVDPRGAAADEIRKMEAAMKSELFGEAMADAGAANRQAQLNQVLENNLTEEQKAEKHAHERDMELHKEQRHAAVKIQVSRLREWTMVPGLGLFRLHFLDTCMCPSTDRSSGWCSAISLFSF